MATEYRLTFLRFINPDTAANLASRVAQILEQNDFGSLTIQFASEGGSTRESLALHNFIGELPVKVHMHAIGHVGSSAVPVFLAGAKRTCTPLARFFLHQYDWGFGTGQQKISDITEALQRLNHDTELARKIIKGATKITDDMLKVLDGGTTTPTIIDPPEAIKLGVVEEVLDLPDSYDDGTQIATWTCA